MNTATNMAFVKLYLIIITNSSSVTSKCPFFDSSCIGRKTAFSMEKNADLGFLGIVQRMSESNFLSKNTPSRCFIPLMIYNVSFFHDGFLAKLLIYFNIRFENFLCQDNPSNVFHCQNSEETEQITKLVHF